MMAELNDDSAVELTDAEATALAWRIVARHLSTEVDWLLWEDLPYLSEQAFVRLCEAVDGVVATAARLADAQGGIDSRYLYERATNASLKAPNA